MDRKEKWEAEVIAEPGMKTLAVLWGEYVKKLNTKLYVREEDAWPPVGSVMSGDVNDFLTYDPTSP